MTKSLPTPSKKFPGILLLLFALILVLTLLKDWWLTTQKPNFWFYLFVPALTILGGTLSMAGVVKICKQAVAFLTLLAISLGVNTLMQVVENFLKIIYYFSFR